jgi:hypothetical protein
MKQKDLRDDWIEFMLEIQDIALWTAKIISIMVILWIGLLMIKSLIS